MQWNISVSSDIYQNKTCIEELFPVKSSKLLFAEVPNNVK